MTGSGDVTGPRIGSREEVRTKRAEMVPVVVTPRKVYVWTRGRERLCQEGGMDLLGAGGIGSRVEGESESCEVR